MTMAIYGPMKPPSDPALVLSLAFSLQEVLLCPGIHVISKLHLSATFDRRFLHSMTLFLILRNIILKNKFFLSTSFNIF